MPNTWYVFRQGRQEGPLTESDFRGLLEAGEFASDDLVWHDGAADWALAAKFLPDTSSIVSTSGEPPAEKSRRSWLNTQTVLFGLFVLFLIFISIMEPDAIPYRVARGLTGAVFGALGGGIAALVIYFFQKRFSTVALSIGAFLGFIASETVMQGAQFIGDSFYLTAVKPSVDRGVLERQLTTGPQSNLFRLLRAHDPNRFAQMIDEVVVRAQGGESPETTMNHVRAKYIEPMLAANAPYMDDDAMVRYIALIVDQLNAFSVTKPELCVRGLRGQPLGDIRPFVSQSIQLQEVRLLEDALEVEKGTARSRYSAAESERLVGVVIASMPREQANLIPLLDPNADVVGRERLVCQVGAAYFRGFLTLPPTNAAALMRSLLQTDKP